MALATQNYSERILALAQEGLNSVEIHKKLTEENGGKPPVGRSTIWRVIADQETTQPH